MGTKRKCGRRVMGLGLTLLLMHGAVVNAQTVPDVRGAWVTGPNSNSTETCPGEGTVPDNDPGGFTINITAQNGSNFSGNYSDQFFDSGFTITETGNITGQVLPNGMFTGTANYTAKANDPGTTTVYIGGGTFNGSVSGNAMNIVSDWVDTFDIDPPPCSGHTETTATRGGAIPPPIVIGTTNPRDVNGDGRADVVWRNTNNGATHVWQMTASGTRGPVTFPGGLPTHWQIQDVADVNGDGRADVVWRNTNNGATHVWLMTAGALRGSVTFPGGLPTNWELQAVADVNGDGRADFVWRNTNNGATHVWQMTASGTRGPVTFPGGLPLNWVIQAVADVNGDGRADVVWRNTNNGATHVWQMTASGTRGPVTFPGGLPTHWQIQDVADVNGDGRADVVWRNTNNGATHVWLMTAGALRGSVTFPGGLPTNWELQVVADVNGDGRADFVWRNTNNGATHVWQMTTGATRGSVTFPGGLPLNWELQGFNSLIVPNIPTWPVTIIKSGSGTGTIISNPPGINCGPTCASGSTASFPQGTTVTLTAIPASGSSFGGWSGASSGCSGTGSCSFTLTNSFVIVGAAFNTSSSPSSIVDKNNGINFRVRPTAQARVFTIEWTVANSTLSQGANEFDIEFFVGGGQQWQHQVVTDEPTDAGIPIAIGGVPSSFCFRMVATQNGSGPILGSGLSGNSGPCL